MRRSIIQALTQLSRACLLAGLILLLIGAYYTVIKAGIPYQDPPLELQIQYAVNTRVGEVLWRDGLIVLALGLLSRAAAWLLRRKAK